MAADDLERETIKMLTWRDTPLKLEVEDPIHLILFGQYVLNSSGEDAGRTAMLLANVRGNYFSRCFPPILARFKQEVESPSLSLFTPQNTAISEHAIVLNRFLLAFSQFEDGQKVLAAMKKEKQGEISPTLRQWLTAAEGFAGDKNVAEQVKTYLNTEKDGSLRAVLVSAYARSAKEDAIPTLEKLLEDRTITGVSCTAVEYGIRGFAQSELSRLRSSKVTPTVGVTAAK